MFQLADDIPLFFVSAAMENSSLKEKWSDRVEAAVTDYLKHAKERLKIKRS